MIDDILKRTLMATKGSINEKRKTDIEKVIDYYNDEQDGYLDELLKKHFIDYRNGQLEILTKTIPLTKYVIDGISLVFNTKHFYEIIDGTDTDNEIWSGIVENLKWDLKSFNSTLNSYVNLTGSPAVKVSWRNNSIQLDLITPDLYDIVQNSQDVTDADAVTYSRERTDTVTSNSDIIWYLWTKDDHFAYTENGKAVPIEGNPNGINPYKIIPIVFVRNGIPVNSFWITPEKSLAKANENINFHLSELNHLVKFQAFSVMYMTGKEMNIKELKVGVGTLIKIPFGNPDDPAPTIDFASPDARLTELLNMIKNEISDICTFYGIDASNFVLSGSPASGISIELKQKALFDLNMDSRPIYVNYIKELFNIIKSVYNYESSGKKFSENCKMKLTFVDTKSNKPIEQIDVDEFDIKYGLTSKIQILMNRGMTEKEATEYLDKMSEFDKLYPINTID